MSVAASVEKIQASSNVREYVDRYLEQFLNGQVGAITPYRVNLDTRGDVVVVANLREQDSEKRAFVVSGIARYLNTGIVIAERHLIERERKTGSHRHTIQGCSKFAMRGVLEADPHESPHWPKQFQGGQALSASGELITDLLRSGSEHDLLLTGGRAMSTLSTIVNLNGPELFVDDAMYEALMWKSGYWPPAHS